MRRITPLCWLVIAIFAQSVSAKKFMKMFADAGIGIHCPSGNKVYIHPISGDLQLCKQQLGIYNETSCPGGTACERFPILIPGFQDYCCWSESNPESELSAEIVSPMSKRKPPGVTVEPIDEVDIHEENEKVFPIDEEEEDLKIEEKRLIKKKSDEEEEEDIEWEFETTTVKPRKTKSRKIPVTTTTEPPIIITTTIRSIQSRRPQCNDPEKTVLIDYGNRLRDCYFQQCLRGFKCEFNKEIRRFICCGSEIDVPPAGLPSIPEPSPVIKRRPFRPNRPFGRLNDGEDDEEDVGGDHRGPRNPIVPISMSRLGPPKVEQMSGNNIESTAIPQPNRKGKYDEDDDYEDGDGNNGCGGNGCTFGRGGNQGNGGCGSNCRGNGGNGGGNNGGCGMGGCRRGNGNRNGNSQECGSGGCPWNGNNNGNRPRRPRPDDYEDNENGCEADLSGMGNNGGGNNGPVPPIPEPRPLCKNLKFKKSGNGGGNNGNNNNNNRNNGSNGPPRNNGNGGGPARPMKPQTPSGSGSNQSRRNGPPPRSGNGNGGGNNSNNRNGNGNSNNGVNRRNNKNNNNGYGGYGGGGDNCDSDNCGTGFGGGDGDGNEHLRFGSRKQPPPKPSAPSNNNNGDRKVPRSVPFFPPPHSPIHHCPEGAEYIDGFTAPKCLPPAIDSCPMSHNKCVFSNRFGHHVCCKTPTF